MTGVHMCSLRSLQEEFEVDLAIEAYAVAQTLVTAEVCECRMPVVGWACWEALAIVGAYASGNRRIVGSAPIVVAGEMHIVSGSAAAGVYYFANCSEVPQTSVLSVGQDAAIVHRVVAEAERSPYLSLAEVDQGTCLLDDIEHLL
jgi:hypothetical protein